jgi:hypothetical protein
VCTTAVLPRRGCSLEWSHPTRHGETMMHTSPGATTGPAIPARRRSFKRALPTAVPPHRRVSLEWSHPTRHGKTTMHTSFRCAAGLAMTSTRGLPRRALPTAVPTVGDSCYSGPGTGRHSETTMRHLPSAPAFTTPIYQRDSPTAVPAHRGCSPWWSFPCRHNKTMMHFSSRTPLPSLRRQQDDD